mmetsp:Transcript_21776/g.60529  ORF Transcript_21776/g.60529 Transcript_21776/m.60529 type:complete len:444 (+) Transcript_21776:217-1548(+)
MTLSSSDNDIVIVSALRTPLCRARKGALAHLPAATLLQTVLEGTLEQLQQRSHGHFSPTDIQDICVGTVLPPPKDGAGALRMAQIAAGLPAETCALSLTNRQCASGLQACATIANRIRAGEITMGIGAGVESMSQHPMNRMKAPELDYAGRLTASSSSQTVPLAQNSSAMDCLLPMGVTSDNVAKEYQLKRHELDEFAAASHQKAAAAQRAGKFRSEIVPVHLKVTAAADQANKKDNTSATTTATTTTIVSDDDGIRPQTTPQILSKLRPVFSPHGPTTAGNSSQTTDGAAAVVLTTRAQAQRRGFPILGIWRGYVTVGVPPRLMGMGPALAIPHVLRHVGLTTDDIDVYEINEAFASQAVWCCRELQLDDGRRVNPNGGAIALGHPLGCTGARLVASILPELHRRQGSSKNGGGARFGVISMCVGTGMGAAAVVEVEPHSKL